jgi:hypothetical protein
LFSIESDSGDQAVHISNFNEKHVSRSKLTRDVMTEEGEKKPLARVPPGNVAFVIYSYLVDGDEEDTILENFFHYNEGQGVKVWDHFGQAEYSKTYYDGESNEVRKVLL